QTAHHATTGDVPVNASPGERGVITPWTPENTPIDPESRDPDQEFYTPQWGLVTPFAIPRADAYRPVPPQPFFVSGVQAELDIATATITRDGRTLPVSRDLVGPVINPAFIAQAEEVARWSAELTDRQKMMAEFWEDATDTAFPPGTWMVFAQFVSARDNHTMDDDAKLFFTLANAMLDASIATWEAKVHYDYVRPVRAIRSLGRLGLLGTPGTDAVTGERGQIVASWAGPGRGTQPILARRWLSYQTPDLDPSPPFAEYPSGHSSFSAAGAEVLRRLTGDDRFGAAVTFAPGSSRFEPGVTPKTPITLAWPTFSAAADEAGASRRYGGIHFTEGDLVGREMGRKIGARVVEASMRLFTGG
ncbi:MAG: vanadium-dependent haloperoxidase, partial [Pikeienuella sp.]